MALVPHRWAALRWAAHGSWDRAWKTAVAARGRPALLLCAVVDHLDEASTAAAGHEDAAAGRQTPCPLVPEHGSFAGITGQDQAG